MEAQEKVFEPGEVKMSKVEKFFNSQKESFLKHFSGLEKHYIEKYNSLATSMNEKSDTFIKNVNEQIQKIDSKYSNMYSMLVRQFLSNLENRVYSAELFSKATLNLVLKKHYDMDIANGSFTGTFEEYVKQLELNHVNEMTKLHEENEEKLKKAQEEQNVQVSQEEQPAAN